MSPEHGRGHRGRASRAAAALGSIAAWAWTALAGGGGAALLLTRGPWPPTNGWFALLSGVAACPLTAVLLERCAGITVSGRARIAAAVFFLVAGRLALLVWPNGSSTGLVL